MGLERLLVLPAHLLAALIFTILGFNLTIAILFTAGLISWAFFTFVKQKKGKEVRDGVVRVVLGTYFIWVLMVAAGLGIH